MGLVTATIVEMLSTAVSVAPPVVPPPEFGPPAPVLTKLASELFPQTEDLFIRVASPAPSPSRAILAQLHELVDGWAGAGSVAPSVAVKSDIASTFKGLTIREVPEVEVDEDGTVALLWARGEETFGLTFLGSGKVIGTLSPQTTEHLPWALPVNAGAAIGDHLRAREIAS